MSNLRQIHDQEASEIGLAMAGYYLCQCENEGGHFCGFGADAISHLYEVRQLVLDIPIPRKPDGTIITEEYRESIRQAIYDEFM